MKKGVVVEYNDDFVTLLTPDGQFLKANNNEGQYELGEEITFLPIAEVNEEEAATRYTQSKKTSFIALFRSNKARVGTFSLVALMVFIFTLLPFFQNEKVYAYMSIDINPSFEVGLDDKLRVISLEPLNEEAEQLMNKLLDWDKKHFNLIVDEIITQSKRKGYVYPGKEILITTVMNEEDKDVENELEENIDEIESTYQEEEMVVQTIETDNETREKAQEQGISMGKYMKLKEKEPVLENINIDKEKNSEREKSSESSVEKNEIKTNQTIPAEPIENSQQDQSIKRQLENETKQKLNEAKEKAKQNAKKTASNKESRIENRKQAKQDKKEQKEDKRGNKQENKKHKDNQKDNRRERADRKGSNGKNNGPNEYEIKS